MFSDRDPANHPDNNRFSNFGSNLAPSDGTGEGSWISKYGVKLAGIGGGIGAIFFGFWSCFTIYPLCILAGILQICAGLLVIALEAPFVFFCVDFIPKMVAEVDSRPIWQKTLLYIVLGILPLLLCQGFTTFIGSGFIFLVAIMYGMKVVGPKVSKEVFILQCLAKGSLKNICSKIFTFFDPLPTFKLLTLEATPSATQFF